MILEQLIILAFTLLGAVLLWRVVSCLQQVTGASLRSNDHREKHFLDIIERLTEKRDTPPTSVLQTHAQERIDAERQSTSVELKAIADPPPKQPKSTNPKELEMPYLR